MVVVDPIPPRAGIRWFLRGLDASVILIIFYLFMKFLLVDARSFL